MTITIEIHTKTLCYITTIRAVLSDWILFNIFVSFMKQFEWFHKFHVYFKKLSKINLKPYYINYVSKMSKIYFLQIDKRLPNELKY